MSSLLRAVLTPVQPTRPSIRPSLQRTHSTHHLPQPTLHLTTSTMKSESDVISEFNSLVNMTPPELEAWLGTTSSTQNCGFQKNDGSGETVGHESGRTILDILNRNPSRDPEGYEEEDVPHMRKVVSYCKRHLAQEEKAKLDTGSKSYRSLKNWGHDALKE